MGLKILHSADWHLDTPFTGFEGEQRELLRTGLRQLPAAMAEICRREGCDIVLLAGDLFDGPATQESLQALKAAMEEWAVPTFVSPGNHDFWGPDSPWQQASWPENVHIFTGPVESVSLPELDCRIWGAGFRDMDCAALLEDFRAQGEERWQLGVLHGDTASADSPYNPITAAQVRESGFHYLALGHIHKAGSFRAGNTLCAWPGCPMGRGWDETGERGYCIAQLEERVSMRWEVLPGIRFREETVDVEEGAETALSRILPPAGTRDFYRVNLTGCGQPDLPKLQRSFAHIPNLWLRDRTEPPMDLWAGVGEDTLEGVYFQLLQEALAEAEGKEQQRILLAAKLSRRLLEGREVTLP